MLSTHIKVLQGFGDDGDQMEVTQEGEEGMDMNETGYINEIQPTEPLVRAASSVLLDELWEEDSSPKGSNKGVTVMMGNNVSLKFRESVQYAQDDDEVEDGEDEDVP